LSGRLKIKGVINTTLNKIDGVNQPLKLQPLRPFLGMSEVGHECDLYLWYKFRWCYDYYLENRILRLFDRGKREEDPVINELGKIGIACFDRQESIHAVLGHLRGHIDGKVKGVIEAPKTVHVLEIKTMSDKYFKAVKKHGLEKSNPIYFAQIQLYMHGTKINRGLFIAVNKNDDSWYIERVYYNKDIAEELIRKAEDIIFSQQPPLKRFKSTWWLCKFCDAREICHENKPLAKNCRSCAHGSVDEKKNYATWICEIFNKYIDAYKPFSNQNIYDCQDYEPIL
jgi:CRISPR/Cas system-associated exonuclease Cas4 (RecB family)